MRLRLIIIGSSYILAMLSSCHNSNEEYWSLMSEERIANEKCFENSQQHININDSIGILYIFNSKQLKSYTMYNSSEIIENLDFYEDNGIKEYRKKDGRNNYVHKHRFYPSGKLQSIETFENDILIGYAAYYYNNPWHLKTEYIFCHHKEWIYKKTYDSITGQILSIEDYRERYIKDSPYIDKALLKLPNE